MPSWLIPALLCLAIFLFHTKVQIRKRSRGLALPPGPKGWPVLGNTLEAVDTSVKPWIRFQEWRKASGARDLMTVHTLGQTNMFIFNAQTAVDLFEKRGNIYCGRANAIFVNELVNKEMILVVNNNQDRVKRLRKLLHEQFSHLGAEAFQDVQLEEAADLLYNLLQKPKASDACFKKSLQRLVLRTTYGRAVSYTEDELWEYVKYTSDRPQPAIAPIVSCFPILKHWPSWMPGGSFHQIAEEYFQKDKAIWERVRDDVKSGMENGTVSPTSCILSRMYATDAPQRLGFTELDMAFVAANLFTAGGDLPEITLRIFTLAMLHFPDVLKRAQIEIDKIVGRERLPNFEDKNRLPFTRAVILEVQRWRSLAPVGVAHTAIEDDWYNGYFIPKGTVVFPNFHAMSMDPEVYPEPEKFIPERFLSGDGTTLNRKKEIATFGYGRRSCSAMHFAEATVFIDCASLIWAFDIEAPLDKSGQRILPSTDMSTWDGILPCAPLPFEAIFKTAMPSSRLPSSIEMRCALCLRMNSLARRQGTAAAASTSWLADILRAGTQSLESSADAASTPAPVQDTTPRLRRFERRTFVPPHVLAPENMTAPPHRPRRPLLGPSKKEAISSDPFLRLKLDPLSQPMNQELLSPFLTAMGKIQPRSKTGLSWKNQRRMGKAVRRARSMGLISYFTRPTGGSYRS